MISILTLLLTPAADASGLLDATSQWLNVALLTGAANESISGWSIRRLLMKVV